MASMYGSYAGTPHEIGIYNIQDWDGLYFVYAKVSGGGNAGILKANPSYNSAVTLKIGDNVVGSGTAHYNALFNSAGDVTGVQLWIEIDSWHPTGYTGSQTVTISSASTLFNGITLSGSQTTDYYPVNIRVSAGRPIGFIYENILIKGTHLARSHYYWENLIDISDEFVSLTRNLDGNTYTSTLQITSDSGYFVDTSPNDIDVPYIGSGTWNVTNPGGRIYSGILGFDTPQPTPTQPSQPVLRTGSVTMTDNNGTTISGFDVTAINHYTGEEFTESTQSDVAVITLPMDRTIEIRNPQTGIYEEAPIGYYRFYGQAPGYKMLADDGIQVSVMPEKYGSYQLCDIRVTSESGYLTGKHQFQIRSRSDNSILQSGTISAKSATTNEWYNTTVSGGIATLTLPYDTSNVQSQYAGNYYVYATSPGYKDSDYGTQIVVMPHTVSEIRAVHLTPIGGIPPAGNVTLRIQAFSETGPGIPNAEIFIAGVLGAGSDVWDTHIASSTGYLTVSVPANSTYDIVASGTGYYDSARRVTVYDDDPGLIEIKLYLSGAPTPTVEPTTQPTGWITPTQTTPPIQEDNLIGLSVKGLAKGFGIDYDTALLMFGLMIIFGAGGMVMSSGKGGAMEFIAGSIVGTFVAFALGLIPIWIFIIIAVVFGAYVLRVFVQGGQ
jgi:hypothetical protein